MTNFVHMTPQYDNGVFIKITNEQGESYLMPQGFEDLREDEEVTETYRNKWFYRLSASGYLDFTNWTGPFDTEDEAEKALSEEWGDEV